MFLSEILAEIMFLFATALQHPKVCGKLRIHSRPSRPEIKLFFANGIHGNSDIDAIAELFICTSSLTSVISLLQLRPHQSKIVNKRKLDRAHPSINTVPVNKYPLRSL